MSLRRWPPTSLAPGRGPLAGLVEVDETEIGCRSVLPWAHRIFSNLKASRSGPWASITGCAASTSNSYLDEFVFRFNRRRPRHAAFRSLLGIAAAHQPFPYKMLFSPEAAA
jgi:hypothetical protein